MGVIHRRGFIQGSAIAVTALGALKAIAAISDDLLVRVEAGDKMVCGFVARMEGKTYVVTNTSLISGHDRLAFKTLSGKSLKPMKIELSLTRNIARFLVEADSAMDTEPTVSTGQGISIVDFARQEGSPSELQGTVAKVYEGRFRPEAMFDEKHGGSPVISPDGNVCGVATVIDFYKLSNASWNSAAMRTVYQLDGDKWFSPSWKKYNSTYGKSLRLADDFRSDIYGLTQEWVSKPKQKLEIEEGMGLDVQRWVKQHNGMVTQLDRARSSKSKGADPFKAVRKDFHDSCKALVDISSSKAKNLEFLTQQDRITPFIKNEFMWRSRELYKFAAYIRGYEKSMERMNW